MADRASRMLGDSLAPFCGDPRRESAITAAHLQHPGSLFLAKRRVDLGMWVSAQNISDVSQLCQQSRGSGCLCHGSGKADGFCDPGKFSTMSAFDPGPDVDEFMCKDAKYLDRLIYDGIDTDFHSAIGTNRCVECLTQYDCLTGARASISDGEAARYSVTSFLPRGGGYTGIGKDHLKQHDKRSL